MKRYSVIIKLLLVGIFIFLTEGVGFAQSKYAGKERAGVSRAHMSRARTLLVEALAEFEEARRYARPDLLIDSEDWRLRLVSLTEQLNRVVDPRPRVTREGAVFRVPPRFVRRGSQQLESPIDGAKSRSDIGELARMKEKQQARANLYIAKGDSIKKSDSSSAKGDVGTIDFPKDRSLPLPNPLAEEADENGSVEDSSQEAVTSKQGSADLFTDDLLPVLSDQEEMGDPPVAPTIVPDEDLSNPSKSNFDKQSSGLESSSNTSINESDTVEVYRNEDVTGELEGSGGVSEDSVKRSSDKELNFENIPQVITDDEVGEVSPGIAAKELSEDEELARQLEESISEKLSKRGR